MSPTLIIISSVFLIIFAAFAIERLTESFSYKSTIFYKTFNLPFRKVKKDHRLYGLYCAYRSLPQSIINSSKILFDVALPSGDKKIDLLILSPKAMFLITAQSQIGCVHGDETEKFWVAKSKENIEIKEEKFQNPIIKSQQIIQSLKKTIGKDIPIHSIIAFADCCALHELNISNKHVVIHFSDLAAELEAFCARTHKNPILLSQINTIHNSIMQKEKAVSSASKTSLPKPEKNTPISHPASPPHSEKCPQCGGTMIFKCIRKQGKKPWKFYGCSNFPKCKYTEKYIPTKKKDT